MHVCKCMYLAPEIFLLNSMEPNSVIILLSPPSVESDITAKNVQIHITVEDKSKRYEVGHNTSFQSVKI